MNLFSHKKMKLVISCIMVLVMCSLGAYIAPETVVQAVETLEVSYLDVGQSDCVLLQQGSHAMIIDAGDVGSGDEIVSYLKKKGIKKLDYVIASHPHADHIGGMQEVIENFSIGKIIMSKKTHTTQTYTDLLKAIKKEGLKITEAKVGAAYTLGNAKFTLLAPNSYNYGTNINDYSVALRMVYKKNSFLFVGDNEESAIEDIMANGKKLSSDVLMCGHHGSDNSTTKSWLNAVNPQYAVISVGANNSYGHPTKEVLNLLQKAKVTYYRTDQKGTIIATSNGKKISFKCTGNSVVSQSTSSSSSSKSSTSASSSTKKASSYVYITKSGTKYHKSGCRYLTSSKTKISLSQAKKNGYDPCKVCYK